ncbi:MAG: hypothetical protein ACKVGZ_19245 [Alphaproteobacteria bacterium]
MSLLRETTRVLFFSRDAGAANSLVPVCDMLNNVSGYPDTTKAVLLKALPECRNPSDIVISAKDYAAAVWAATAHPFRPWAEITKEVATESDARAALTHIAPKLIVTGTTDIDDDTDRLLWLAAAQCEIPSAAIIDEMDFLPERFRLRDERMSWPSRLLVHDQTMRTALSELAPPNCEITIVGDLHALRMKTLAAGLSQKEIEVVRTEWQVGAHERAVLFASSSFAEMKMAGRHSFLDEFEALAQTLTRLSKIGHSNISENEPTTLIIRPHPKDTEGKYDSFRQTTGPRVIVSRAGLPLEALMAADIVTGTSPVMLRDAAALGRPTLAPSPAEE